MSRKTKRGRRYHALPRVLALLEQYRRQGLKERDAFEFVEQLTCADALCELIDATAIPLDQILNVRASLVRCQALPDLADIATQTLEQLAQPHGRQPLPRALVRLLCDHGRNMSKKDGFSRLGHVGRFSFFCQLLEQIKLSPAEKQLAAARLRTIENTVRAVGLAPALKKTIKNLIADP